MSHGPLSLQQALSMHWWSQKQFIWETMWTLHWIQPYFAPCLLCSFAPWTFFPLPFPIYLSINLLNSLSRSPRLSVWLERAAFIECRSHCEILSPRCLGVWCPSFVLGPRPSLIKCDVNIKALKWWRWNNFKIRTVSLNLFCFYLLHSCIFLLKCV